MPASLSLTLRPVPASSSLPAPPAQIGATSAGELVQRCGKCGQLQPRDLQQGPGRMADELHQRGGVQRGCRHRHRAGAAIGQWRDLLACDQHRVSPQLRARRGLFHVRGPGLLRGGRRLQPHLRLQRGAPSLTYAFNAARPLSHCASTTLRPRCASPSPPRPVACFRCATHRARRTRGTSST